METLDFETAGMSKEEIINARKFVNDIVKDARKASKHSECLWCGNKASLCNSHTIPQFILRNIANNGKLKPSSSLLNTDIFSADSGINNAAVFHLICRPCDGSIFQDYENEDAYRMQPTDKLLNQIALKNVLRDIYKHESEVELYKNAKDIAIQKNPFVGLFISILFDSQSEARERDVQDCYELYHDIRSYMDNNISGMKTIWFHTLDYVVPIAYQGMIALTTGFDGEVITNHYDFSEDYRVEYLQLVIFPLMTSSVVLLFTDNKNTKYDQFELAMKQLTDEERLKVINYILFLYTEDFFISPSISEEILENCKRVASSIHDLATVDEERTMSRSVVDFDLKRYDSIPNLLDPQYAQ